MSTSPVPYLGSKISLLSRSEIRYEGILYTIDAKESTLALAKVRSFGTEDRPTDRPVAARDEVYEYIIFRAADIKDLHVCEPPRQSWMLASDPAIVHHSAPIPSSFLTSLTAGMPAAYPPPMSRALAQPQQQQQLSKVPTAEQGVQVQVETVPANNVEHYPGRRRGSMSLTRRPPALPPRSRNMPSYTRQPTPSRARRYRSQGRPPPPRPRPLKFENSFDFEEANAKFLELEKPSVVVNGDENKNPDCGMMDSMFYDPKKSFFDKISCFSVDGSNSLNWRKEQQMNHETFGVYSWSRGRAPQYRGNFSRGIRRRPFSSPPQPKAMPQPSLPPPVDLSKPIPQGWPGHEPESWES